MESNESDTTKTEFAFLMAALVTGYFAMYNIISAFHALDLARIYRNDATTIVGRIVPEEFTAQYGYDCWTAMWLWWFQGNKNMMSGDARSSAPAEWARTLTVEYTALHQGEIQTFRKHFPMLAFKTIRDSLLADEVELYVLASVGPTSAYPRLEFHLSIKERFKRQCFRIAMACAFVFCWRAANPVNGASAFVSIGQLVVLVLDVMLVALRYIIYRHHILHGGKEPAPPSTNDVLTDNPTILEDIEWPSSGRLVRVPNKAAHLPAMLLDNSLSATTDSSKRRGSWTGGIYRQILPTSSLAPPPPSLCSSTKVDEEKKPRSTGRVLWWERIANETNPDVEGPPLDSLGVELKEPGRMKTILFGGRLVSGPFGESPVVAFKKDIQSDPVQNKVPTTSKKKKIAKISLAKPSCIKSGMKTKKDLRAATKEPVGRSANAWRKPKQKQIAPSGSKYVTAPHRIPRSEHQPENLDVVQPKITRRILPPRFNPHRRTSSPPGHRPDETQLRQALPRSSEGN